MLRVTTESGATYLWKSVEGLVKRTGPSEDEAQLDSNHPDDRWLPYLLCVTPQVGVPWKILWLNNKLRQTTRVTAIDEVEEA